MDDLDLTLKALGTQLKGIISLVETYAVADRPKAYATAIDTLATMSGEKDPTSLMKIKLGVAISIKRSGGHSQSVDQAARLCGAI